MSRADVDLVTALVLAALVLGGAFFAVRPGLWARVWFHQVDPRPVALMRIAFGLVGLWTFIEYVRDARFLFTDEGLWLTSMARRTFGRSLAYLWDPLYGFEHWWKAAEAILGPFTVFHLRSDPPFVFAAFAVLLVSLTLMILGVWTGWTTVISWVLTEQLYRYSSVALIGADTVVRVFLFLGMFSSWGEAYSIDSWRRRRRAILDGGQQLPAHRPIPAWPIRLMMLQLACIYGASGLSKTGVTWGDGTALYYVLNGDHFYRVPAQGVVTWLQYLGVLPVLTWVTRWWEVFFPVALAGMALNGYENDRVAGRWPPVARWRKILSWVVLALVWGVCASVSGIVASHHLAPEALWLETRGQVKAVVAGVLAAVPVVALPLYRSIRRSCPGAFAFFLRWVVGKRTWLGFGLMVHLGIDVGVNLGTFPEVMMAVYLCWLSGGEVDKLLDHALSQPLRPGEGPRPARTGWLGRVLLGPLDRLRYRRRGLAYTIRYHPDEISVRRAALLRIFAPRACEAFVRDESVSPASLRVESAGTPSGLRANLGRLALQSMGRA